MDGAIFLQQVVNGMSLGGMYALIAIGYTMVYGVLRLINFAHADVMMVGAFSTLFLFSSVGLPFGVAVFLTLAFGSVIITNVAWIVPLITVLLLLAILWLLYRTRYGMAIRAVAFDVNTVRLMGIDANRIISLVFALGSSLAALGGVFYSISYPTIDPLMGVLIGLKAFAAAVLGGIGSVTGAVLGGFILGFTEVVAVAIFPELGGYKDAFAFLFLILVLLFRPVGIMGDERLERSRF